MTWHEEREHLLKTPVSELALRIEGSDLEPQIKTLYDELSAAGLEFKPPIYLSDEWGCPEGVPIIGVPFYLSSPKLAQLEAELEESLETPAESLVYLRHEAGHAFNYAYRLFEEEEWHRIFGPYSRPYIEDYKPDPFSRDYVRHIPGWYAQKHPDEDFAETFAVWLTPGSSWREAYAGTRAMEKLCYVDRVAARIGKLPPIVRPGRGDLPVEEMIFTVGDYYERRSGDRVVVPRWFDGDLRQLFSTTGTEAVSILKKRRAAIIEGTVYWSGVPQPVVRSLVDHLIERVEAMELRSQDEASDLISFTSMVTTLVLNYMHHSSFVPERTERP